MIRSLGMAVLPSVVLVLSIANAQAQSCEQVYFSGDYGPTTIDIVSTTTSPAASARQTLKFECTTGQNGAVTVCIYGMPTADQTASSYSYFLTASPDYRLEWYMVGGLGNHTPPQGSGSTVAQDGTSGATSGQTCSAGVKKDCNFSMTFDIKYQGRSTQDRVGPGIYSNVMAFKVMVGSRPGGSTSASYCSSPPDTSTQTVLVSTTVTAEILTNCQLESLADVDFGSLGSVALAKSAANAVQAVGNISVRCTYKTPYSISIDNGLNLSGSTRRMKSGTTDYLAYQLYQPGCIAAWNLSSVISGIGTTVNTVNSYAPCARLVTPLAKAPVAGIYSDTVVVTATF